MLHLYGRFCNASKLAGEVDLFEALDAVKRQLPHRREPHPDPRLQHGRRLGVALRRALRRTLGRGRARRRLQRNRRVPATCNWTDPTRPRRWEQKLWHLYDATDYAANLSNTATVAYNGEIDPQKQAADVMERAMAEEGLRMIRIVGPQTPHRYHPDSKVEIDRTLDAIAERGRDPYPRKVRFTTWTLAYNQMNWVTVDALGKHWERARVDAEIDGDRAVSVETSNVTAFTLAMGPGGCPLDLARKAAVTIDGQKLAAPGPCPTARGPRTSASPATQWARRRIGRRPQACTSGTACRARSTTPSSTASSSSRPPARPLAPGVAAWVAAEEKHAISEWRRQFRGDAQVRDDKDVTDADIAASNLVLWGDPGSNRVLARIADRLPVKWTADAVVVGQRTLPGRHPRADPDLSEPAQPEEVRGAEQRLHLPRIRLPEQRPPDPQTPGLRHRRHHHSARTTATPARSSPRASSMRIGS